MRKILLMSSALALLSGTVEAGCIQTPSCSSLGYSSTTACEGGLKCPWGNAWFCNVGGGGSGSNPDYSNCKIGDILYSDMSCNANMIASKTPIGVVFDVTNTLAIAKDEFANLVWGAVVEDVSGVQNSSSVSTSTADWQGFKNTKAMYEADKSGVNYPAIKKVLTYSTTGTEQGQWYLPAVGELQAISTNKDTLNTTLSKIGGTQMSGNYWSSSEQNSGSSYYIGIGSNSSTTGRKIVKNKAKPVINFGSKNKTDFAYNNGGTVVTCRVGDILYSDKKCYLGGMLAGKTPIGVVFDADRRTAIALSTTEEFWSRETEKVDIPGLTNIEDDYKAKQDFNGKANTAAIKAYNSSLENYPAAYYAYNYKTTGTNVGEWYLPALGELNTVYSNKDYMNYALSLVGKKDIPTNISHWSSSEYSHWSFSNSDGSAWYLTFRDGFFNAADKYTIKYVRPVLAF